MSCACLYSSDKSHSLSAHTILCMCSASLSEVAAVDLGGMTVYRKGKARMGNKECPVFLGGHGLTVLLFFLVDMAWLCYSLPRQSSDILPGDCVRLCQRRQVVSVWLPMYSDWLRMVPKSLWGTYSNPGYPFFKRGGGGGRRSQGFQTSVKIYGVIFFFCHTSSTWANIQSSLLFAVKFFVLSTRLPSFSLLPYSSPSLSPLSLSVSLSLSLSLSRNESPARSSFLFSVISRVLWYLSASLLSLPATVHDHSFRMMSTCLVRQFVFSIETPECCFSSSTLT